MATLQSLKNALNKAQYLYDMKIVEQNGIALTMLANSNRYSLEISSGLESKYFIVHIFHKNHNDDSEQNFLMQDDREDILRRLSRLEMDSESIRLRLGDNGFYVLTIDHL